MYSSCPAHNAITIPNLDQRAPGFAAFQSREYWSARWQFEGEAIEPMHLLKQIVVC
jgi:hypothetical protein